MLNKTPVEKNGKYTVSIYDIGITGEGIGKTDGFTVFVPQTVPGDVVEVLILKVKKSFAYGKLLNVVSPSSFRQEPQCKYFYKCGGCQLLHMDYEKQLLFKTKKVCDALRVIGGFENIPVLPAIASPRIFNYRNKAQIPVAFKDNKVSMGFYANRSHRIIDIDECAIQNENTKIVQAKVKEYILESGVSCYDEETGKGLIRHILVKYGFKTGETGVCIIINGDTVPKKELLLSKLLEVDGVSSITSNINKSRTNVILGEQTKLLWGRSYIVDTIGDLEFEISPNSFFQVNPFSTEIVYSKVLEFASLCGNENILDIYCGIGTISLFLARRAKRVFGVEIVPEAISDAVKNAKRNNIANAEFICGDATDVLLDLNEKEGFKPDIIVVDPPRKGCEPSVLHTIIKSEAEKLIYVSCDPGTLARDLKLLCENGYELKTVQPVDQFPQTVHVETVVLMSRVK
ncbi:MAG: 23S rRNA (uracil(1939)-C(5))-methyltransferase RlmD [Lachnospiraceae bacterium]|nr:23S rRNA (uracil(1939)-C(5))-methyltransferase RlmD [Lachnospiraceae bacterium]